MTFSRVIFLLSVAATVVGIGLIQAALKLPVYFDATAANRLSIQVEKLPEDQRFAEWFGRLRKYETSHKGYYDLGTGIAGLGLALAAASAFGKAYQVKPWIRSKRVIFTFWVGLWLIRIPLYFWYYGIKMIRGDYPSWGDSVAIPLLGCTLESVAGAVVTTPILGYLFREAGMPASNSVPQLDMEADFQRTLGCSIWVVILVCFIARAIPRADLASIIPPVLAINVLLLALCKRDKIPASNSSAVE